MKRGYCVFPKWLAGFLFLSMLGGYLSNGSKALGQNANANPGGVQSNSNLDHAITQTIERNFILDPSVPSQQIEVRTDRGVVTLSGAVDNALARNRAARIAQAVQGVSEVRNRIQFKTPPESDEAIRKVAEMRLAEDPGLHITDHQVRVQNGTVTLAGSVPSWAEREHAAEVAEAVPGVRDVKNGLSVQAVPNRPDDQILGDVQDRLKSDVHLEYAHITARVRDGQVSLIGDAPSIANLARLYDDAWVAGAKAVDTSGVKVTPSLSEAIAAPRLSQAFSQTAPVGANLGSASSGANGNAPAAIPASDDARITAAVDQALQRDPFVGHALQVQARNGTVTLSGDLDNLRARQQAVNLANAVPGVTGVLDNITVTPPARSDDAIRQDVQAALSLDPATHGQPIEINVHHAVVTLGGVVHSWQEQQTANTVAQGVKGVRDVRNDLTVAYRPGRSDDAIAADIRSRLRLDAKLRGDDIAVNTQHGVVTLSGAVRTPLEKRMAIADAWVLNVRSIQADGLLVHPQSFSTPQANSSSVPDDAEIEQALLTSFRLSPYLAPFNLQAKVDHGTVVLTGTVNNRFARALAAREAQGMTGVQLVRNLVEVRPPDLSQGDTLAQTIWNALDRDPILQAHDIKVSTRQGRVALNGSVDATIQRLEAEQVASTVPGVVTVQNNLAVRAANSNTEGYHKWPFWDYNPIDGTAAYVPKTPTDLQIQQAAADRISSDPELKADRIEVRANEGVVVLTGQVRSPKERSAATADAYDTGATAVQDQLEVQSGFQSSQTGARQP